MYIGKQQQYNNYYYNNNQQQQQLTHCRSPVQWSRAHRWPALGKVAPWPESRKRRRCRVSYSRRRATNNLRSPCDNWEFLTVLFRCFWSCQISMIIHQRVNLWFSYGFPIKTSIFIVPNQDSWGRLVSGFWWFLVGWDPVELEWGARFGGLLTDSADWRGSCNHVKLGDGTVIDTKQQWGGGKTCQKCDKMLVERVSLCSFYVPKSSRRTLEMSKCV